MLKKNVDIMVHQIRLIVEDNDNKYTRLMAPLLAETFALFGKNNVEEVYLVQPRTVWNCMRPKIQELLGLPKAGKLSRNKKKNLTRDYLLHFMDVKRDVSYDICDAYLNSKFAAMRYDYVYLE